MKRNLWKKFAAVSVAAMMCAGAASLAGCNAASEPGPQGVQGPQGIQGIQGIQGERGEDGTKWFTGKGLPTAQSLTDAKEGDFYVNTYTNTVYVLESGVWTILVNINERENVSTWNGRIPGWQAPDLSDEQIIANRPVSYVLDETAKTVDIYNAEAFAWFAYRSVIGKTGFAGYTVNLHCDVDLDNHMWVPIGLGARSNAVGVAFAGTFNGNGHTVKNINGNAFYEAIRYGAYTDALDNDAQKTGYFVHYENGEDINVDIPIVINSDNEIPYGLFATTSNATIKNLRIEGIKLDMPALAVTNAPLVSGKNYSLLVDSVGALVGYAHGNLTLENVTAGAADGSDYIKNAQCAAGIVGRAYAGTGEEGRGDAADQTSFGSIILKNCVNYVNVSGVDASTGSASLLGNGNDKTGGIVAFPRFYGNIEVVGCENYGAITGHMAGGIIGTRQGTGTMLSPSKIIGCTNYGKISSDYAGGGIIGYRSVSDNGSNSAYIISDCINYGEICESAGYAGQPYLGGIAGWFQVTSAQAVIVNCVNFGNFTALETRSAFNAGGVVGYLAFRTDATGTLAVINCVNNGNYNKPLRNGSDAAKCYSLLALNNNTESDVLVVDGYHNLGKIKATN